MKFHSLIFLIGLVFSLPAQATNDAKSQDIYEQMEKKPMLYQVTTPHVVSGAAPSIDSKCTMPPGTIYYDKPHKLFIFCDGQTWKPFPDTAK